LGLKGKELFRARCRSEKPRRDKGTCAEDGVGEAHNGAEMSAEVIPSHWGGRLETPWIKKNAPGGTEVELGGGGGSLRGWGFTKAIFFQAKKEGRGGRGKKGPNRIRGFYGCRLGLRRKKNRNPEKEKTKYPNNKNDKGGSLLPKSEKVGQWAGDGSEGPLRCQQQQTSGKDIRRIVF